MDFNTILTKEAYNNHQIWFLCNSKGIRLSLNSASLSNICLDFARLCSVDFNNANLQKTSLHRSDLSYSSFIS